MGRGFFDKFILKERYYMELITKKNITVEKLHKLFGKGRCGHSPLFHFATKKGVLVVELVILSGGTFMIKSPKHTDCIVSMPDARLTYLNGTLTQLVGWIKDSTYGVTRRNSF